MSEHGQFEGMSEDTFDQNKPAILAGLNVLMDNPKSRKRFRLAALYERSSGELLAEVFETHHGLVVVHRGAAGYANSPADGRYNAFRQARRSENLIVTPLTGDPDQHISAIVSRSTDYRVGAEDFWLWLTKGLETPAFDGRLMFVGDRRVAQR